MWVANNLTLFYAKQSTQNSEGMLLNGRMSAWLFGEEQGCVCCALCVCIRVCAAHSALETDKRGEQSAGTIEARAGSNFWAKGGAVIILLHQFSHLTAMDIRDEQHSIHLVIWMKYK